MDSRPSVALVAQGGPSTRVLYNSLRRTFRLGKVVLERPPSRTTIVRSRAKRLGISVAAGETSLHTLIVPVLRSRSRGRWEQIKREHGFVDDPSPEADTAWIDSVNSAQARR